MTYYHIQYRERNRRKYRNLDEIYYTEQEAREVLDHLKNQTTDYIFRMTPAADA